MHQPKSFPRYLLVFVPRTKLYQNLRTFPLIGQLHLIVLK
jgi:hypothetical protein